MKKVLIITAYDNSFSHSLHHQLLELAAESFANLTVRNLNDVHGPNGFNAAEEQVQLMLADIILFQFPVIDEEVSRLIPKYFNSVFESDFAFSADKTHLSINKQVGLISIVEGEQIPTALCKGVLLKPVEKIINECDWDLCGSLEIIFNNQFGFCRVSPNSTSKMRPTGKDKYELYLQFIQKITQSELQPLA